MRKQFIGGNWKMNGTQAELYDLVKNILNTPLDASNLDIVVFPSFVYLSLIQQLLAQSPIALGAQNVSEYEKGAYTGEIAASMLRDIGCRYVLVGHSERRHIYSENNETIAKKFKMAMTYELTPVLCVGETRQEREKEKTESIILAQLNAVIDIAGIDVFEKAIVAYEPVWAIGTGLSATPDQAQTVHVFIRQTIAKHSDNIAKSLRIIYGGSIKSDNAKDLFSMPDIDGGLIGSASLKASEFVSIIEAKNLSPL
jgi:triosephosphate isomerase